MEIGIVVWVVGLIATGIIWDNKRDKLWLPIVFAMFFPVISLGVALAIRPNAPEPANLPGNGWWGWRLLGVE